MHRITRGMLTILVAGLAVGCASTRSTQTKTASVLRAQRFELVNAEGAVVAVLAADEGSHGVYLFDAAGHRRAALALETDGPALTLLAADASPKVVLNLGHDGHPGLSLNDATGKTRYDLRLRQDERPCMLFWDVAAPKPRMGVGINPAGNPNIVLFDAEGNRRAWMQMLAEEGPSVGVGDASAPVWNTPEAK